MQRKVLILMVIIIGSAVLPAGAIACGGGSGVSHDAMSGMGGSGTYEQMHARSGYMGGGDGAMRDTMDSMMGSGAYEQMHGGDGYMGGGNGTVRDTMDGMMGSDAYEQMHGGNGYMGDGYMSGGNMDHFTDRGMNRQSAEEIIGRYMEQQKVHTWRFGDQNDGTTYYMSEILGPDGELIDRVMVDKSTGRLHSLEIP